MTDKHTPGPWWHDNNEGYGANNIWASMAGDKIGKDLVAVAVGDSSETEANARLIAAAPDLLAAMEWVASNGMFSHPANVVNVAKDAIAKARGQA